ncbi:MAG: VOC family protein [Acidobacteriota bacterium]|nr:VOC family protein [Acidobacteriota bacterium]
MNTEASNPKFHLSLDVKNVEDSVRFYSILFGMQPSKLKPGYAKFDLERPAVNLTLQENAPCCITGLSHMGVRVDSTTQVLEAKQRLQAAGLATFEEANTTCCYAVQDKIWVTDPTGYRWEVYVFKGDSEQVTDSRHEQAVAAGSPCSSSECAPAKPTQGEPQQACCSK